MIIDDNSMLRETTRSILKSNLPAVRIFEAVDLKEALAPKIVEQIGVSHICRRLSEAVVTVYPHLKKWRSQRP